MLTRPTLVHPAQSEGSSARTSRPLEAAVTRALTTVRLATALRLLARAVAGLLLVLEGALANVDVHERCSRGRGAWSPRLHGGIRAEEFSVRSARRQREFLCTLIESADRATAIERSRDDRHAATFSSIGRARGARSQASESRDPSVAAGCTCAVGEERGAPDGEGAILGDPSRWVARPMSSPDP